MTLDDRRAAPDRTCQAERLPPLLGPEGERAGGVVPAEPASALAHLPALRPRDRDAEGPARLLVLRGRRADRRGHLGRAPLLLRQPCPDRDRALVRPRHGGDALYVGPRARHARATRRAVRADGDRRG